MDIGQVIAGAYAFSGNILAGVVADLIEQGADKARIEIFLRRVDDRNAANITDPVAHDLVTRIMAAAYAVVQQINHQDPPASED